MKILTVDVMGLEVVLTATSKELMRVGKLWKRNAKSMLKRHGHVATGTLLNSMHPKLSIDKKGNPQVVLTPQSNLPEKERYWEYVNDGVRGATTSPFPGQLKSPFKYRTKKPPLEAIEGWMKVRNIKPRDKETGQFKSMTHRTLAFIIQNSIFHRGLKPTFFITATQKRIEKKYSLTIAVSYAEDLGEALKKQIEDGNND